MKECASCGGEFKAPHQFADICDDCLANARMLDDGWAHPEPDCA